MTSASILGLGLSKLSLELKGVADSDFFAWIRAGDDLDGTVIGSADHNPALLETVGCAHEHDRLAPDGLKSGFWHQQPGWLVRDRNLGGDERTGAPSTAGIRDFGDHPRRAGLLVEERANEDDFALCPLARSACGDGNGLSLPDHRQISWRDGKFDP